MQVTDRDKKILIVLPLIALVAFYWFVLLTPKREEKAEIGKQLTEVQATRDEAVSKAAQLDQARRGYAEDYSTVIRLGKALPTTLDAPSLIVQLDRAARGTGIEFDRITTGEREASAAAPPPADGAEGGEKEGGSGGDAAAGGEPAGTAPGQAVEGANNAAATANGESGAAPAAAGAGTAPEAAGGAAAGLESVPLDFEFTGSFFDLADFFHRMKRFVRVHNEQVLVRGRLITIDAFKFTSGEDFPQLKAEVKATVYLAPRAQGAAAGGTPAGPGPVTAPASGTETATTPTPAPTAAVTR
jgi:Tfp pilus assembly protein PilO